MQLLTPFILFATIFTGTFHMVSVSALPYDSTEVSRHPVPFSNNNSLERRSPMNDDQLKAKMQDVHSQFDWLDLDAAYEAVARMRKNPAKFDQISDYIRGTGSRPQDLSAEDEEHARLMSQWIDKLHENGINAENLLQAYFGIRTPK
ncbi:hypothetical protein BC835DRAFT_1409870 [Cytidiella melzeri]|nr:hypothetical protein BC835DRAFT_1409870 [Cytidiella melzeri]